jgi:hypothetical protein
MFQKFRVHFPSGEFVNLTRRDFPCKRPGETQIGGRTRFQSFMLNLIETVFPYRDYDTKYVSNKVVYRFKVATFEEFRLALKTIKECGYTLEPIETLKREIR